MSTSGEASADDDSGGHIIDYIPSPLISKTMIDDVSANRQKATESIFLQVCLEACLERDWIRDFNRQLIFNSR
jgi:hypothetical protein